MDVQLSESPFVNDVPWMALLSLRDLLVPWLKQECNSSDVLPLGSLLVATTGAARMGGGNDPEGVEKF